MKDLLNFFDKPKDPLSFTGIRISLASADKIREWSFGEVKKPETINYRTFKPERDGLFCAKIFGPVKDYECNCGKYKRMKHRGVVCEKCGVEVIQSKVRRERLGHIELATPVAHIWFLRSLPSRIGAILDISLKELEKVLYCEAYVVLDAGNSGVEENTVLTEEKYVQLIKEGHTFTAGMGGEAIRDCLKKIDIETLSRQLRRELKQTSSEAQRTKLSKRLKVVESFKVSGSNKPEWMMLEVVPVIPPELRPLVPLDGGRFATSDLNDLYRRVINRNNRLKRLMELNAPEIIIRNEKRMLQESVDALFDNGRRGKTFTGPNKRPLRSLSDMLKGKQGRFRQNLLGKRVDYSGRSVIVVGPELRLHQCGLPKVMALELFKPFIYNKLSEYGYVTTIKSAKKMVEKQRQEVWDILEEVVKEHPVLLNRAPTLHRLGIQAFEPVLIEGKAIQLHPLVCAAFNADFDGDQMAVHVPLSAEAQAEARVLMLSTNNILSPANGRPITSPTQDMVLGLYSLTREQAGGMGEGQIYSSVAEAIMAFDAHSLGLQSKVKIRFEGVVPPADETPEGWVAGSPVIIETTLGRALFNDALPADYPFVNVEVKKSKLGEIINDLAERYAKVQVAATLDALKEAGFHWATRSGVTISFADVVAPESKGTLLAEAEEKAEKIQKQYDRGLIADSERKQELIEVWTDTTNRVAEAMTANFPATNPVWMMVNSGARGNMLQIRQIAGMRGLVANPKGEIIPRPIKSNFREGLSVLEYFISTHGARKGLADTALRTADSGYLTRRLVDVSQDVIIREDDCGTDRGLVKTLVKADGTADDHLDTSIASRCLADDVVASGKTLYSAGTDIGILDVDAMVAAGVTEVKVRSVLTCDSRYGTCAKCYGRSLATGKLVDIGEAVGIIAAQSIGEPGTQLTMRTFHTGGAASDSGDITHGLPRVVELFEARTPKGVAPISAATGRIRIEETDKNRKIVVIPDNGDEEIAYAVPRRAKLATIDGTRDGRALADGDTVQAGQPLLVGKPDPKEVLRIRGPRQVQIHLTDEVQEVYRSQGVSIHDKHIEVIVRQMLKRVVIVEQGDSAFLTGELVERAVYESDNRRLVTEGGNSASARPELMGITKASLATESWLSAASFQETTRVLTDAAINGKKDPLLGLKENVIIGKLIPAGTGLPRYRNVKVEPTAEAKAAVYATMGSYDSFDYTDFGAGSGEAVRLDDFDYGRSNS